MGWREGSQVGARVRASSSHTRSHHHRTHDHIMRLTLTGSGVGTRLLQQGGQADLRRRVDQRHIRLEQRASPLRRGLLNDRHNHTNGWLVSGRKSRKKQKRGRGKKITSKSSSPRVLLLRHRPMAAPTGEKKKWNVELDGKKGWGEGVRHAQATKHIHTYTNSTSHNSNNKQQQQTWASFPASDE